MRITEQQFLESLNNRGRKICSKLTSNGKSRRWLADTLGITTASLNKKLKTGFSTAEDIAIKQILNDYNRTQKTERSN